MTSLMTYREALALAMMREMEADPDVFVFGLDVPDHKRTKAKTTDLTRVVGPGNFQLVDIFGSNLLEGGIVRAVRTAQVICPTDGRLLAVTDCHRQCEQRYSGERGSDRDCFHDESVEALQFA